MIFLNVWERCCRFKTKLSFGFEVFVGYVIIRVGFLALLAQPNEPFFGSSFFGNLAII